MAFRVGQKVVCVDDAGQNCDHGDEPVVKGRIYLVRDYFDWFGSPGIRVKEIINPLDRGYQAVRFRPIVERKTDISIFTEILHKATKRQDA